MRKQIFAAIIAMSFCSGASASDLASVESISMGKDNATIVTDRPVVYDSFTQSNPFRLVLEMLDTTASDKDKGGSGKVLRSVSVRQYTTEPVSIARAVFNLDGKASYNITQEKEAIKVSFKAAEPEKAARSKAAPEPAAEKQAVPAKAYYDILSNLPRDVSSFDYNGDDVRAVLDIMAARMGVNMVYADDVSGGVDLHLKNVPFSEAFNTVLAIKGLAAQQMSPSILRITSAATLNNDLSTAPQITRVYQLKYLKLDDAKTMVENVIKAEGRRGNVNVYPDAQTLVVTDIPSGQDSVAALLAQLDKKPIQVLIEAKIVEVNLSNSFNLGIQWSAYGGGASGNGYNFFGSGSTSNQSTTIGAAPTGVVVPYDGSQTTYLPLPNNPKSGGTGVTFPTTAGELTFGAFRFGRVTGSMFLDATLSAAEQKGKAKVLSDPKVATVNNKEANINITTQIPYITTETTNSNPPISKTVVTYITTGIQLTVTPRVNDDGTITMLINPSVSQVSATVAPAEGGAPGVDTRNAKTIVMTRDGDTVAIGGLIYDSMSDILYKVPLLGDIPLLGWFFKKKSNSRQRIELLIFVTPKII
ncbi:MAG: hypothetical protein GX410_08115 [Elusimicrobia bacterium]|nr:hypothetical protein [Elusimicrobiota bacterium]